MNGLRSDDTQPERQKDTVERVGECDKTMAFVTTRVNGGNGESGGVVNDGMAIGGL